MRIQRKDSGKTRWYVDLDADGERIHGVTRMSDEGLPKKALIAWSGNATAEYAIDHWDELGALPPSARLAKLKRGRYEATDEAKGRGTQIHRLAEHLINGEEVAVSDLLRPYAESYTRFLDEFQVRPVWVETLVYSETHRYVAVVDLIADLLFPDTAEYDHLPREDDGYVCGCLLELKSNRTGIFGETALQLAGQRYAERMQPNQYDPDTAFPMPEIEWTGAVWIRQNGYSLVPVLADEQQHRTLLYVREVGLWDQSSRDLISEPVDPPTGSRWVLVKADEDQS